jgi:hypothetical protein
MATYRSWFSSWVRSVLTGRVAVKVRRSAGMVNGWSWRCDARRRCSWWAADWARTSVRKVRIK